MQPLTFSILFAVALALTRNALAEPLAEPLAACGLDGVECPTEALQVIQTKRAVATKVDLASELDATTWARSFSSSAGMRRVLHNASALVYVAATAGISMNLSDAERNLLSLRRHGSAIERTPSGNDMLMGNPNAMNNKRFAKELLELKDIKSQATTNWKNGGADPAIGIAIGATSLMFGEIVKSGLTGRNARNDVLTLMNTWIPTLAPLSGNPAATIAATIFCGLITGFFSTPGPDPMSQLYEKIMEDVNDLIDKNNVQQAMVQFRSEAEALADELAWVPGMLDNNQVTATNAEQTRLTYFFIIQHDVAKLTYQIRNSQSNGPTFRGNMMLTMMTMANLQIDVLLEIALIESGYGEDISDRIQKLVAELEPWFNLAKPDFRSHRLSQIPTDWGRTRWDDCDRCLRGGNGGLGIPCCTGGKQPRTCVVNDGVGCLDLQTDACAVMQCSAAPVSIIGTYSTSTGCNNAPSQHTCHGGQRWCTSGLLTQYRSRVEARINSMYSQIDALLSMKNGQSATQITSSMFSELGLKPADPSMPSCQPMPPPPPPPLASGYEEQQCQTCWYDLNHAELVPASGKSYTWATQARQDVNQCKSACDADASCKGIMTNAQASLNFCLFCPSKQAVAQDCSWVTHWKPAAAPLPPPVPAPVPSAPVAPPPKSKNK